MRLYFSDFRINLIVFALDQSTGVWGWGGSAEHTTPAAASPQDYCGLNDNQMIQSGDEKISIRQHRKTPKNKLINYLSLFNQTERAC